SFGRSSLAGGKSGMTFREFRFGSRRGGEGFFEDGLKETRGVGAGVRDLRFQCPAMLYQRLHPLHDGHLLGEGRKGDRQVRNLTSAQVVETGRSPRLLLDQSASAWR